ncbi:MAG: superoxide dismutase [Sphingomonadales bacterium]|jgi:Fe-Mn family superoxide dismutase
MFALEPLPYPDTALEPVISARTLHYHHGKHHAAYVKTVNDRLRELGTRPDSLEDVIAHAAAAGDRTLFNAAQQTRNHSFFWAAMAPQAGAPDAALAAAIAAQLGGMAGLRQAFVSAGTAEFGSGWVWLVSGDDGDLAITTSHDADFWHGAPDATPLLVCDVWEHAYYLDHQNDRNAFLAAWFDALPNWDFASHQFAAAGGRAQKWHHADTQPAAAAV